MLDVLELFVSSSLPSTPRLTLSHATHASQYTDSFFLDVPPRWQHTNEKAKVASKNFAGDDPLGEIKSRPVRQSAMPPIVTNRVPS